MVISDEPQDEIAVSVVIVVKDRESTVEKAVDSVLAQTAVGIELVVVDGASADGTLAVLKRYQDRIARLISEPDEGIADAMNKGLAASRGEWVYFLGADDRLAGSDVFSALVQSADGRHVDIISGSVLLGSGADESRRLDPRGFGFGSNFKTPLLHQGTLCRRSLFQRIGDFDASLAIAMDYDFFLRAYREGESVGYIDRVIALMDGGGIGSRTDWVSLNPRIAEERRVHLRHCDSWWLRFVYFMYHPAYWLYRRIRALAGV